MTENSKKTNNGITSIISCSDNEYDKRSGGISRVEEI